MIAPPRAIYLESFLAPIAAFLERGDITDIFVNRPGEVWIETLGGRGERHSVPALTGEVLARLVRQIAASSAQGINRESPLLTATLPGGERVQAVIPPATRGEIALAIRKQVVAAMTLDDYAEGGATRHTAIIRGGDTNPRRWHHDAGMETIALLREAVRAKRNVLVSGGTASGKTTLVNALLREIPPGERLVAIEDTAELQLIHANSVGLIAARGALSESGVSAEDLLIASLRLRPDRIVLGEIRGREAMTFLRAVNTGHPGSMTTIHADSAERAIDQLALIALQAGMTMGWDDIGKYIRSALDVIVQLRQGEGGREIETVLLLD